jgi:hypothetical protein
MGFWVRTRKPSLGDHEEWFLSQLVKMNKFLGAARQRKPQIMYLPDGKSIHCFHMHFACDEELTKFHMFGHPVQQLVWQQQCYIIPTQD